MKEEVLKQANLAKTQYPRWRWGQTIFNVAYELFPEAANKLRGTPLDCFYDDSKVEEFLNNLK